MSHAHAPELQPLLVPCTTDAAHAFCRAATCPTCHGSGQRPAEPVEYVLCDERQHEHELRTEAEPPTLEGYEPDRVDGDSSVVWDCIWRGCGGTIILARAGA